MVDDSAHVSDVAPVSCLRRSRHVEQALLQAFEKLKCLSVFLSVKVLDFLVVSRCHGFQLVRVSVGINVVLIYEI